MTASSSGISPAFVLWMIKHFVPTGLSSAHSHIFKRLKRLKFWDLSAKGILFQFVSTSVHIFSDSSPPYLLVCAADTRREHGIPAVTTWNPNTVVILLILLLPQPKNPFSSLRDHNWTLETRVQLWFMCPFQYISPFPSTHISPILKLCFIIPTSMIFSFDCTQMCIIHLNALLQSGLFCTGGTSFSFHLFSLSWCHLQSFSVILSFLCSPG